MVYQVLTWLDFIIFLSILLFPFHILSELRYMCYNAGHRCYGRVHMTPVDTVIESCSRTLELPLHVGSVVFLFLLASTEG